MDVTKLYESRASLLEKMRKMLDTAEGENRNLNGEETGIYEKMNGEMAELDARIKRCEELAEMEKRGNESKGTPEKRDHLNEGEDKRSEDKRAEYRAALREYARTGRGSAILEDRDILGISTGTTGGATGGYLIPTVLEKQLVDNLKKYDTMRRLSTVKTSASPVTIPVVSGGATTYLVAEGASITASTPTFTNKALNAYKLATLAYVTWEELEDSAFDMEAFLANEFARSRGEKEEDLFINGDGSGKPYGVLTSATNAVTTAAATTITGDNLIDLMYAVDGQFRQNGSWLMNDTTVSLIRKLKGGDGQYIWQNSMQLGQPDMILGHAVYTSGKMPAATAGNKAVAFGDFGFYRIQDRTGTFFHRLTEVQATTGQVGFLMHSRTDGLLLDTAAVKTITMHA